jgi:nucleoside-diphosphate-sugar epimerase
MHILVTGAAGMIGRKLTERLAKDGALHGRAIEKLTLADVFTTHPLPGVAADVEILMRDLASPVVAEALVGGRPDVIFHTAGIVSAV